MCGIGGFSLSAESKIKPRVLANAMLTALESRGSMASGFAYQDADVAGVYKQPINGASLRLKALPKDVKNVILHTRLATHGSIQDNRNNHPVLSPGHKVALVHNGVIYNHESVRLQLESPIDFEVDTSVIPALIEEDPTLANLTNLDGDAAIAWLSDETPGVVHVARLEHSPLCFAQLADGSTLFTSTEALMWQVLIQLDLEPTDIFSAPEYTYYQLRNGLIAGFQDLERPLHTARYSYDYGHYRSLTAGGSGSKRINSRWDDDMWDDDDLDIANYNNSYENFNSGLSPEDEDVVDDGLGLYYFYIEHRDALMQSQSEYTYYDVDEYDLFKNDIWYLNATKDENYLLDYGRLTFDSGIMDSYKRFPNLEVEHITSMNLV